MTKRQAVRQKWPVSRLKEHARQRELFGDLSDAELDQLVAHMHQRGLETPVEILPDGMIIAGHQRVRAAKLLGWTEIDVIIRHDLQEAGDPAVEERLINDNLVRRQLSPLGVARCIRALLELEQKRRPGRLSDRGKEQLKAKVAKLLGKSSRTVSRYLLALKAPAAVQAAFEREEITLIQAGKVALLPARKQAEIAARIEDGEQADVVITPYLTTGPKSLEGRERVIHRLVQKLKVVLPQLQGKVAQIRPGCLTSRSVDVLQSAQSLLAELITMGKSNQQ